MIKYTNPTPRRISRQKGDTVHRALFHDDPKIQSALRQGRGVMVGLGHVNKVRSIEKLAERIMSKLDRPDELGADDVERMDALIIALGILLSNGIIELCLKTHRARITRMGRNADLSAPPQRQTRLPRDHKSQPYRRQRDPKPRRTVVYAGR